MDGQGITVSFSTRASDVSLIETIHTGPEAHQDSYSVHTYGLLPWSVKQPVCDAGHSPPSNAKFKNECNLTYVPSKDLII
jgi:hypothetical protein